MAASTTEAEYIAAAQATKEALWLRLLLADLGIVVNTFQIMADNQSALKLLKNPVSSMRSKHIDVVYHFARERVARRDVEFSYIRTDLSSTTCWQTCSPRQCQATSCKHAAEALEWNERLDESAWEC